MFLHLSAHPRPGTRKAGGTHPTGMLSCLDKFHGYNYSFDARFALHINPKYRINKFSSLRQLDSLTKPATDKISHVIPVFENCHVPNCVKENAHHKIVKTY